MNILKKYWGTLRRQRFLHFLNNLRWYGLLKKNRALYDRFGVKKGVLQGLSHKDITLPSGEGPWLDAPDALRKLKSHPDFPTFPDPVKEQLESWINDGYLILSRFVPEETCDRINGELDKALANKTIELDYTNSRVMNFMEHSQSIRNLVTQPELVRILDFILDRKTKPFQTINFTRGSQQNTHSDSIHMTTEPLGYLLAIWVALEDIKADSGPLHYYPGSHKLPYVMSEDFENDNTAFSIGSNYYEYYERAIASLIEKSKLEKKIFLAKKGDLLIWHANILHGGEKKLSPNSTRKSLVAHYFCEGEVINYHEITQRPAIIRSK